MSFFKWRTSAPLSSPGRGAVKAATSSMMMSLATELGPVKDTGVAVRMFGYLGPGWPDRIEPLVTVNRSEAPPDEPPSISALF